MRILVTALGSPGHSFPLVPLARALCDAGHDVTFATAAGPAETIATSGVPTLAVGTSLPGGFEEVMHRWGLTERPDEVELIHRMAREVFGVVLPRASARDLLPRLRDEPPDLVIAEVADTGAALAARGAGVPCVLHSFGRRPPPEAPMSLVASDDLATLAGELGIEVAAGQTTAHGYLDICPPSLREAGSDAYLAGMTELPLRPVAWNPPTPFTARRRGGRPWVLLTLGTAFGEAAVLRTALAGLRDVDVLLAAGSVDAGALADLEGDGVQVESFVPQADLLRGDLGEPPALVVHHGGSGTTFACSAAGIPQLFLPQGADQFFNAAAVTAVSAGIQLLGPEATPAAVGEAVRRLLDDGPERAAARALASEVAGMPSPAEVAASVEEWGVARSA